MIKDWQKQLLSIPPTDLVHERFFEMMKIFYEAFPSSIIQLYQYSILNGSINGILSFENSNIQSIAHIHQTLNINTYVHEAILDNEVRFFNDSKFQLSLGNQFVLSEPVYNMVIVPLSINGIVIGYLTGVNVQFEVNDEVLEEIRSFSDSCIHILHLTDYGKTSNFTEKELIVMQYIANGYSTKEISHILKIAESTVKYFLKNVMLKTNSKNRTEVVSKLFRVKLLH